MASTGGYREAAVTGAETVLRAAVGCGIDACFANPGTTELPLVQALDRLPQIRAVLGVFEGVCTGAADGYSRISGRPAIALLHLGPGLANGLANLHNARRAGTPVIALVGDHATWHLSADAPLTSDIASFARPVSHLVHRITRPELAATETVEAVAHAVRLPSGPVTLIVPADVQWAQVSAAPVPCPKWEPPPPEPAEVERAARILRSGESALVLGGRATRERGLRAAQRVSLATGCRVFIPTFPAVVDRAPGLLAPERIPYAPEPARHLLSRYGRVVLAGTREPVAFFGYPDSRSGLCAQGAEIVALCGRRVDEAQALEDLADALGAPTAGEVASATPAKPPRGPLNGASLCMAVAAAQPEGAIVMDEGATTTFPYYALSLGGPRSTYMTLTGGAIGQGLPCAVGAAAAAPERRVIALEADGSSLYTIQALWTMARERQNVTTVLCSNRAYAILRWELERSGAGGGRVSQALTGLDDPEIDFTKIAQGFGVEARCVRTAEALVDALGYSLRTPGPMLIEAVLE